MRSGYVLLALMNMICLSQPGRAQNPMHDPVAFACSSRHFMVDDFQNQPVVKSPDGKMAVRLTTDGTFDAMLGDAVVSRIKFPDIESNIEIGWSPDSSQFFISYSDGGAIGGFHVHLYRLKGIILTESRAPAEVAKDFKAKHWCKTRGNNLSFLDWTPDSKIGFFVAEVYPTSDCGRDMGFRQGYAVNIEDGKIVRVFTQQRTDIIEKSCREFGTLLLPP